MQLSDYSVSIITDRHVVDTDSRRINVRARAWRGELHNHDPAGQPRPLLNSLLMFSHASSDQISRNRSLKYKEDCERILVFVQ